MRHLISFLLDAPSGPSFVARPIGPGKRRAKVCHKRAANPVPMTRQVARRNAIDTGWGAKNWLEMLETIERVF